MQTEKEKWIDDVLKSTDGVSRAAAPDMSEAVLSRLGETGRFTISAPVRDQSLVWRIAASVVFLIALNGVTIYSYQNNIRQSQQAMSSQSAASELGIGQRSGVDVGSVIFGN